MNVLHIGSAALAQAFRGRGHQVLSAGLSGCDLCLSHPLSAGRLLELCAARSFTPDCALWLDNGNLPFVLEIESLPCPSFFYSIDTYCNPWHIPFSHAFDHVLVAQKRHAALFPGPDWPDPRPEPEWLPLFAPDSLRPGSWDDATRTIPVSFVGTLRPRNIPHRERFLHQFKALHPLVIREGAYAPLFGRSRIVLNQTAVGEVNFRCFEAMACGAALLTEAGEQGLTELFTPGVHILPPYPDGDARLAANLARDWLNRPQELQRLARAGCELVQARHMARQRALRLEELFTRAIASKAQDRRLRNLPARRTFLSTAYAILAAELTDPRMREHRELYRRMFASLSGGAGTQ
jgi:hypothetical protein